MEGREGGGGVGCWRSPVLVDLLVTYAGHNQGDVPLDFDGKVLHKGDEGRPGCYFDIAVDLEVQKVGALEYMVFIAKGATGAEATDALLPGDVIVTAQFYVQTVIGAAKVKGLGAEVVGTCV